MVIMELKIKCPNCGTDTILVSQEVNPLIFECHGCNKKVILHNNRVYNVSSEYFSKLLKKHKYQSCGQILLSHLSDQAKNMITEEKIDKLKEILGEDEPVDASEIIDKLP